MSGELLATVIAGLMTDSSVTQQQAADVGRIVGALVGRGAAVGVYPTCAELPASAGAAGFGLGFIPPSGARVRFSGTAIDDEALRDDLQALFTGGGVFLVTGVAPAGEFTFPATPCSNGDLSTTVSFTSADDFEQKVLAGEMSWLSAEQLAAVREDYVFNCGEQAACPGTLGPKCPKIA